MAKNIASAFILAVFILVLAFSSADSTSGLESATNSNLSNDSFESSQLSGDSHSLRIKGKSLNSDNDLSSFVRDFDSAKKKPESAKFIKEMLTTLAGQERPTPWNELQIQHNYALTQLVVHVQNLEGSLEILHLFTPPEDTPLSDSSDQTTFYTSLIQQADEQNISTQIVVPISIIKKDDLGPVLAMGSKINFGFKLRPDKLARQFNLRKPDGEVYKIGPPSATSFDPLSLLDDSASPFNDGQYEIQYQGKTHSVVISPRLTEPNILTLEVEVHEMDSLMTYHYVLVYEPI